MPDINSTDQESLLIPREWAVPKVFRRQLGDHTGKQRCLHADNHILLILHEVPSSASPERIGHLFWRSPEGKWLGSQPGDGYKNLRNLIKGYERLIDNVETMVIKAKGMQDYFAAVSLINPVLRAIANGYKAIETAITSLREDPRDLVIIRDLIHEQERAAFLIAGDAKLGLEFAIALQSEEQSRISLELAKSGHRLNMLVGLFLPITAIGSVFGMNLINGLEAQPPYLFWGLMVFALVLGFIIRSLIPTPALEPKRKVFPSLHEIAKVMKDQIKTKN